MEARQGELARTRRDAIDVARRRLGCSRATEYFVDCSNLWQPGSIESWNLDHGARILPCGEASGSHLLDALGSLFRECGLEHGGDGAAVCAGSLGGQVAQPLELLVIEIGPHG